MTVQQKYTHLVLIVRLQIPTEAHLSMMMQALDLAPNLIAVLCGANAPRTPKNPFSVPERIAMVQDSLGPDLSESTQFVGVRDQVYNDGLWVESVIDAVNNATLNYDNPKFALVGGSEGKGSNYFRNMFPFWGSVEVDFVSPSRNGSDVTSMDLRHRYFSLNATDPADRGSMVDIWVKDGDVSEAVARFLHSFISTDHFADLQEEYNYYGTYQEEWGTGPYITVDACVFCGGNVLLVERGDAPGRGLWALPGGFLDKGEWIENAMVRELYEETNLHIPQPVIRGSIKQRITFDAPDRSERGRVITHGFLVHLAGETKKPKVKGGSDAKKAFWAPTNTLTPDKMFEDHYSIIRKMMGLL